MPDDWLILHAGALGDLVLTLQLVLRLPGVGETGVLRVISRTNPGDLSACRPSIVRQSSEGLGLHWLFGDHDDPPPEHLRQRVHGARVLSALGGTHTIQHHRLAALEPAGLYSIDPRPRAGVNRHITEQWQTQLAEQGLLVPKCIHQRPAQRCLGVPDELRERGRRVLREHQVVLHPGSGGRFKCWPLPCFLQSARQMQHEFGAAVCFLLGVVELDTWPMTELESIAREFRFLHSTRDGLAAFLAAPSVYIGNDAGPAHLAALLGTPTVTIFGPTPASVWRPLGPRAEAIIGDPSAGADWGIDPGRVVALAADVRSAPRS